jgi:hypothetical protein
MSKYSKRFYQHIASAGSAEADRTLVPLVLDLVPAKRLIDLGCARRVRIPGRG